LATTFIAKNTTLGDTFETNYAATEGGIIEWIRELSKVAAAEVESDWSFANLAVEKTIYHLEIGKVDWSNDRAGPADWFTRFRTGANGDADVELNTVTLRRVSADGLTIRASIVLLSGGAQTLPADTDRDNNATNQLGLDNPAGAAVDDHLVIIFEATNTSAHGGADVTSAEQNTSAGTRIVAPIDDPAPAAPGVSWHGPIPQPLF